MLAVHFSLFSACVLPRELVPHGFSLVFQFLKHIDDGLKCRTSLKRGRSVLVCITVLLLFLDKLVTELIDFAFEFHAEGLDRRDSNVLAVVAS